MTQSYGSFWDTLYIPQLKYFSKYMTLRTLHTNYLINCHNFVSQCPDDQ